MDEQILAAARDCLLRDPRRVTLVDVARRANVSRPTIYRRWSDANELIREVVTRETALLLAQMGPSDGTRATLVRRIVTVAKAMHDNPVLAMLRQERQDFLATYVFQRMGTSQLSGLRALFESIEQAQGVGEVRQGDPMEISLMTLVLTQSVIQSTRLLEPWLQERWSDELARALDGYLRP